MQCDVYENPRDSAGYAPFLLDIQADLLSGLDTHVVVPLVRAQSFGRRVERLHPMFEVAGQQVVMATHLMAAIQRRSAGAQVTTLADQRDTIISAIDVLLSGV
jgi:toxin CcdB